MVVVPAGKFMMGSPEGQGSDDEHPQHEVTFDKPFAVSKLEVTFDDSRPTCLPWRLQPACQRQRLGARPATSDQCHMGRCKGLCRMALQNDR